MVIPTLVALAIFPLTFGAFIIAAAAVFAVTAPLFRDHVLRNEAEHARFGGHGADAHMHIPEVGFDMHTGVGR
jgi:hypothetical protein